MLYLSDERNHDYAWPEDDIMLWQLLKDKSKSVGDRILDDSSKNDRQLEPIHDLKEVDLMKHYYRALLQKTGGNVKSAAKSAGLKESTFRNRMKKLGMSFERSDYQV